MSIKTQDKDNNMSSGPIKPIKLLLPGLFLLILGVGNITVGMVKGAEYQQVLEELEVLEPSSKIAELSPLRRIQVTRKRSYRPQHNQEKARARCDFYRLVRVGGAIMMLSSLPLLVLSAVFYLQTARRL